MSPAPTVRCVTASRRGAQMSAAGVEIARGSGSFEIVTAGAVPVPASATLALLGLAALVAQRRRALPH